MKSQNKLAILLLLCTLLSAFAVVFAKTENLVVYAEEGIKMLEEKPEVAEVEVKNFPNRIFTTIYDDPKTNMSFAWYTTDKFEDALVLVSTNEDMSEPMEFKPEINEVESKYLEKTAEGHIIFSYTEEDENGEEITLYATDEGMEDNKLYMAGRMHGYVEMIPVTEYTYHAVAEGLEPDTQYFYQLGSKEGVMSAVGKFHTASEESDSLKFIHFADTQNAFWNENVYNEPTFSADAFKRALEVAGDDLDFVIHGGDVVERGEIEDEWLDLCSQMEESMLQVPLLIAPGNHEDMRANRDGQDIPYLFNYHINQPVTNDAINSGSYFSFDYNNIHFVLLNTEDNRQSSDNFEGGCMGFQQLDWLEADLAAAVEKDYNWIIAAHHKPLFSKTYWSFDPDITKIRFEWHEIYDKYGVDLALQAHSHCLSRSLPLAQNLDSESFIKAEVADFELEEKDGIEYYVNPQGAVYTLPNGIGTKSYEITHVSEQEAVYAARPDFIWMENDQIDHFNGLFADLDVSSFERYDSVDHDCALQHFTIYEIKGKELTSVTYEISGDLHKGEEREMKIVDQFGIVKED